MKELGDTEYAAYLEARFHIGEGLLATSESRLAVSSGW
jgi:hypothetical protein